MMMMATATKGKRPLRHLTATDKIDAIQRIHDGESKASVARDIGVPESTLRGWCKNEEKLRYMSRQSVENAEKLSSEATAAALTAAAAAELFSGPPEKRLKLDSAMFGGNGKLHKYEDSFYKVAAAAAASRGSLNGLDLSGGGGGGGGGGPMDKTGSLGVSGGDIIMNGLGGSAADFSQFAKTAAEISALSKSKAYGAELGKHHHHHHHLGGGGGGDPSKSDHHLSMAAISPLTSLSHLSGMSGLGQSPLALSFNDIATNLNLFAQLNNNHSLATMSSLAGGLNTAAAAAAAAQSLRNVRPKGSSSSAANNNGTSHQHQHQQHQQQQHQQQIGGRDTNGSSAGGGGGGGGLGANNGSGGGGGGGGTDKSSSNGGSSVPSLTVRNLAKLQQQKSSSGELLGNGMLHQQPHAGHPTNLSEQYRKSSNNSSSNNHPATSTTTTTTTNASVGRDPNAAPVDDALWYWLKSQQTMLGLNNLYSSLPRATSHSPPTPPPPSNAAAHLGSHLTSGSPTHHQQTLPSSTTHTPQTPPPPLVGPPLVSTPQPTPPSSAPSLTPEDTKNSSWFWQWYKTFGASLMPGGAGAGGGAGGASADSKQQQREQQHQAQQAALAAALHHNNNNSLSQQNNNNNSSSSSSSHHQKGGAAGSAAAAASLTAAYENILYSQLTKGTTTPSPSDTLNNNHHHHLNHHLGQHHQHHHHHASLSSSEPIDLNIGQQQRQRAHEGDPKPEDLSNHHHHHHHLQHGKDGGGGGGVLVNGDGRRSRYNNPSRPSSASSAASSSISAHHRSEEGGERMGLQSVKIKVHPDEEEEDEQEEEEESVLPLNRQRDMMDDDVELAPKSVQATGDGCEVDDATLAREDEREELGAGEMEEELTENHRGQRENVGDEIADDGDDEDIRDGEKGQQSEALTDDGEELKESSAAGAKRRRSSAGASAKEVLDSILYSSNSNDRTIDSTSSPAITPSPIAMVRERSTSPAGVDSSVNKDADEATQKGGADSLTGGDDIKSDMSDDSNHTPAPSSSTTLLTVASVAVADIRNSTEAVEHGEKFLKWLEACSDPNVTAMQVMQFKYLLNSIKLSAERQQLQTSAASGGAVGGAGPEERTRIRKRK